jgi:DNA-binding transcriptional regulator YdaS (Cro superfamily)
MAFLDEKGMTVKRFSELYGFNQFSISKWANGHRSPRLDRAQTLERLTRGKVRAIDWD